MQVPLGGTSAFQSNELTFLRLALRRSLDCGENDDRHPTDGCQGKRHTPERAETPPFGLSAGEAAETLTGAQQTNRNRLGTSWTPQPTLQPPKGELVPVPNTPSGNIRRPHEHDSDMSKDQILQAKEPWYRRLLGRVNRRSVRYDGTTITVEELNPENHQTVDASTLAGVTLTKGITTNSLTIRTKDGQVIEADGLAKSASADLHRVLSNEIQERELDQAAAHQATQLAPVIHRKADELQRSLPVDRYIRHSTAIRLREAVEHIQQECSDRVRRQLDSTTTSSLNIIDELAQVLSDEEHRRNANAARTDAEVKQVAAATADILPSGLTHEQARAIATDEDATLVLAGAGTGKTAVVIGKIAHLVRNQGITPGTILALAFNRKAAMEIRERLPEDLKGAHVSTFHSFGLRVISECGTAPSISKIAQDDFAYGKAIQGIVDDMKAHPKLAKTVLDFVSNSPAEYVEPFDFTTTAEYEQYVRDNELRTLNGELVKSFEEVTIANFLSQNGIPYQYEARYEYDTATSDYRQYEPDFYLPDHSIYIEHFALNRNGRPPPGWTGYAEGVAWKRALHAEYGTELLETYSWQHRDDTLLSSLEERLRERGVEFRPLPTEDLVDRLSGEKLSILSRLLATFLHHVKSANLSDQEVEQRTGNARDRRRAGRFAQLFSHTRAEYERLLLEEDAIDFHDLINQAVDLIRTQQWANRYQHVLIDEFQDISEGRMALASALNKPNLAYFLVGDDWQSIYRFAGSHVGLIHECDRHLGYTERVNLTKTFRFGDGILKPSSAFVQRNPEQTKRSLVAHHQDGDHGITVIATDDPEDGVDKAFQLIHDAQDTGGGSVLVLGRFQSSRAALGNRRDRRNHRVEFSTVHSAKGREADYVVILDLADGRYGFPCLVVDDLLLHLVAPPTRADPYPYAEERRLFYVALTRARKGAYLIADRTQPSPFVRELLSMSPEVRTVGAVRPSCPVCNRGSLVRSQSGDNLRCTNSPVCRHLSPRCPNCRVGYATINANSTKASCSNLDCHEPPRICPECRKGVVVLRTNPRRFWACSRYYDTPSCTFTRQFR